MHALVYIVCSVVFLFILFYKPRAKVSKYDYLSVLSYHHWLSGREVRKKMEKYKLGRISVPEMYQMLSELEDEGLVERRIETKSYQAFNIRVHEFRLKKGGQQKSRPDELVPITLGLLA